MENFEFDIMENYFTFIIFASHKNNLFFVSTSNDLIRKLNNNLAIITILSIYIAVPLKGNQTSLGIYRNCIVVSIKINIFKEMEFCKSKNNFKLLNGQ